MKKYLQKINNQQVQWLIFSCFLLLIFFYPLIQYTQLEKDRQKAFQSCLLILIFGSGIVCLLIELVNHRLNLLSVMKVTWISVVMLAFFGVVSILVSENKEIALYGSVQRYEGFFSLLGYYFIFFIASLLQDEQKRKQILFLFEFSGVIICFTGILQYFDVVYINEGAQSVARVPMNNQNFFASYCVLLSGCMMMYLFMLKKTDTKYLSKKLLGIGALIIYYITGLCCMSSVIYVGMIMCFFMLYCINFIGKKKKALLITELLGLYILIIIVLNFVSDYRIFGEAASVVNQIAAEESIFGDSVGSGRMRAWKQIISLLPEYGVFGCGIEQLGSLYIERFGYLEGGIYFDRAHNEYLHIWITQGLFALISYLVFLFAIYIPGHLQFSTKGKYVSDDVSKIAFLAFFGYIAQAFFNISVIQVAPYFWMLCGLIVGGIQKKEEGTGQELKMVTVNKSEKGIGEKPESKSLLRN